MSLSCSSCFLRHQLFLVSNSQLFLRNSICTFPILQSKHWSPKFHKLRAQKIIKVELPDIEEMNKSFSELSKEEIRAKMKEKGVLPQANWIERPFVISSSGEIFDPYVPPEGDGKVSFITKEGAKQKVEFMSKKGKSMMAIRKIKKNDEDFNIDEFLVTAQDIYVKAHEAMLKIREDEEELQLYVTEKAYPEILHNALDKTIRWKMLGLLEEPRVVQARLNTIITKENFFAQITVRFHTKQMLAVYDRFGRLMYGSEILAKDVLEYVIFEKHISNRYGSWRVHAKIIPDWMPPKDPVSKTYRIKKEDVTEPPPPESETTREIEVPAGATPALATA